MQVYRLLDHISCVLTYDQRIVSTALPTLLGIVFIYTPRPKQMKKFEPSQNFSNKKHHLITRWCFYIVSAKNPATINH